MSEDKVANETRGVVYERLMKGLNVTSKRAVSLSLGMSESAVRNADGRKSLPWEGIVKGCLEKGVSLDYVFTGKGSPILGKATVSQDDLNNAMRDSLLIIDRIINEQIASSGPLTADNELRVWKDIKPELIEKSMQFGLNEPVLKAIAQSAFRVLIK